MFEFQKLNVYSRAKDFALEVQKIIDSHDFAPDTEQLLSTSSSVIMIDIARGSGQIASSERSAGFADARASVFASAATLDYLLSTEQLEQGMYDQLLEPLDTLSRMLYSLSKKTVESNHRQADAVESAN